jgi:hypothetical protein
MSVQRNSESSPFELPWTQGFAGVTARANNNRTANSPYKTLCTKNCRLSYGIRGSVGTIEMSAICLIRPGAELPIIYGLRPDSSGCGKVRECAVVGAENEEFGSPAVQHELFKTVPLEAEYVKVERVPPPSVGAGVAHLGQWVSGHFGRSKGIPPGGVRGICA